MTRSLIKQLQKTFALFAAFGILAVAGPQLQSRPFTVEIHSAQDERTEKKPLPPLQYIRSRDFDTKHIALDLRFDWEKEQTIGVEEFTFSPLKPDFRVLVLDAGGMIFDTVRIKDGGDLEFEYDEDRSKLTIRFDRYLSIGDEETVVIKYRTKGAVVGNSLGFGGGGGLRFVKPTKEAPGKPWQIWSQGETEYNKYWFPSYDYPNDFRTTELRATVKEPLMVISNGVLVETIENGDGSRTFHWKMDTPFTNYLSSIVVGEFVEVRGNYKDIPVSTYVYKDWKSQGEVTAKRLPDMVRFYSEKLGVVYPYPKYAQTIAHEFGGGMENITATTQTDNMIIDERTELDGDWDGLQAHELAHQWFGDYVTCRDWSEIWLNESFATYLDALYQLESKGKDEFLWENKGNQEAYFGAWNQGNRRPIVTKYYANPDAVFDAYAYPRGGAVLHMLRKQLGDTNFWRALGHYLRSNANQPVSTEDFRIAIEETTGQSMDAFFDQWLYRMGHPVFEVGQEFDKAATTLTLKVKQVQDMDLTSSYPQVKYFETPVDIEIVTPEGTRIETVYIEAKEENTFVFEDVASPPLLIDFDNEGTLIKELKFERSVDELIYQLNKDSDIIGRVNALKALAAVAAKSDVAADEKKKVIDALNETARNDQFWRIRSEAISEIRNLIVPRRQQGGPAQAVVIDVATLKMLEQAAGDPNSTVRAEAIRFLGTTNDRRYFDLYRRAIMNDKSYGVIDAAAAAMAGTRHKDAYSILRKLAQTDSWRDRLMIAGLNGLSALEDKRALDLGFKFGGESRPFSGLQSAALGLVSAVGKDDPRAFPLIFGQFRSSLDKNAFNGIFSGLQALVRLSDPRGQEAFDLAREKFKTNQNLLTFVSRLEGDFKKSMEKMK